MAISGDGKIASANRALTSFGSERDSRHFYELRTQADAVLCGARTIEEAHSTMGNGGDEFTRLRLRTGKQEYPLRVVISGSGSISPTAEIWSHSYGPIIVATTTRAPARRLDWLKEHAAAVHISRSHDIDWPEFLGWLRREHRVERALSEGGGVVNDGLIRAGVVGELHLTWCPLLIAGRKAPTISDGLGVAALADASRFKLVYCRKVGSEWFLRYRPV